MRSSVRTSVKRATAVVLIVWVLWIVALGLGHRHVAIMHDNLMAPAVPMGALVFIENAGGKEVGDIVGYFPAGRSDFENFVFGFQEVRRYAGGMHFYADAQPGIPVLPRDDKTIDRMGFYFPFVGYVIWFGPILVLLGFILLSLTREPGRRVAPAEIAFARMTPRWAWVEAALALPAVVFEVVILVMLVVGGADWRRVSNLTIAGHNHTGQGLVTRRWVVGVAFAVLVVAVMWVLLANWPCIEEPHYCAP